MNFFNDIKEFFTLASQNNFNISVIYEQSPNSVYSVSLIVLVLFVILYFIIQRNLKISKAVKISNNISKESNFENFDKNLEQLVNDLPKRGEKLANSINENKELILKRELELIKDFDISKKIDCYVNISKKFEKIANNSKKFNIDGLSSFFEENSKILLHENLFNEIENFIKKCSFSSDDFIAVKNIIAYSNNSDQKIDIQSLLHNETNKISFSHNLEFIKFYKQLTKENSGEYFKFINKKIDELFESEEVEISSKILFFFYENDEKEKVYNYISNLKSKIALQQLYFEMFGKSDENKDIDLDLSFVANETKIQENYKEYLDNKFTFNWSDLAFIKHILNASRVLETIGHIHYRNVLERIETLETQKQNNKAISEALEIARRAEFIANEAKTLANKK